MGHRTVYRTLKAGGLSIFYREAGPKDAPTLLLLHGFPSSSRMFEPLFARLSDRYHVVAPDYPGFGHSDWPDPKRFDYTFDHVASVTGEFTEALGLSDYTLCMQDYGGPVGFRLALAHPERVRGLVVRTRSPTTTALGRSGRPGGPSGRTGPLTKQRCAKISCPLPPRRPAMSERIHRPSSMIRICGRTSTHS